MLRRIALVAALVAASPTVAAEAAGAQSIPVPVSGPDPALITDLDAVVALSPEDVCLTVAVDGTPVYDHRGTDPQVPASTQKLITAAVLLDAVGEDWRYETAAVALGPVRDGVLVGDLVVRGSGDPALVTESTRRLLDRPETRPSTVLDQLADQVVAAGIERIDGAVLADESRYDEQREVATWPPRHARQNLAGPLSAAAVDHGYQVRSEDGRTVLRRSPDPALDTAAALTWLLVQRGVEVGADPGRGPAGGGEPVATVESPPLRDLVADVLARSDNTAAEAMLKEIGARGGAGTTAGGAAAVATWLNGEGLADPGAAVVDGSGLDTGNQVSCRALVDLLDGRPELGSLLPVAGRSGTLSDRFVGTDAEGVLRAKTGSLNEVTSLAGHVELPDGGTATFAYIANGQLVDASVLRAQDYLAQILATHRPPCPEQASAPIADPALARLAQLGAATGSAAAGAAPALASGAAAVEARAVDLVDRCSASDGTSVVLAPEGLAN